MLARVRTRRQRNRREVNIDEPLDRLADHARRWRVTIEDTRETASSLIAFGTRPSAHEDAAEAVVIKVVRTVNDEWDSGAVLDAFDGHGLVRVLDHQPGALLIARLSPGTPLSVMSLAGRDADATTILAGVIDRMRRVSPEAPVHVPTAERLGRAFDRYLDGAHTALPRAVVSAAALEYTTLCASQRATRLLHGDLQHYNVLSDDEEWTAIDPKGVVAELEYELGASLRNPVEAPGLFTSRETIARRIAIFEDRLAIDVRRALRWARAQAVLSLIWCVEDGLPVGPDHPQLELARVIGGVLEDGG